MSPWEKKWQNGNFANFRIVSKKSPSLEDAKTWRNVGLIGPKSSAPAARVEFQNFRLRQSPRPLSPTPETRDFAAKHLAAGNLPGTAAGCYASVRNRPGQTKKDKEETKRNDYNDYARI